MAASVSHVHSIALIDRQVAAVRAVAAKPIRIDDGGCEQTLTNAD